MKKDESPSRSIGRELGSDLVNHRSRDPGSVEHGKAM
jgi:hypothetical protein